MAGELKQIYQLNNGIFNGSSLVPFEVPNTDPLTSAEKPYITRKTTGDAVSEFVAKTQEFETDLQTDDKTIIGAINELKEGGGGNADKVELTQAEYDELSEEEKHNGKLYFITDGQAGGGSSIDFVEESIPDIPERELPYYPSGEYSGLNTTDKHIVGAINEVKAKKLEYWTLIYKEPADNTTHKLVTLQNGRKFSDYDFIIFNCISGGLVRNSLVRPSTRFSSDKETMEVDFSTSTETRWACLHFVSDTTAEVWAYASGVTIDLYGMKIS